MFLDFQSLQFVVMVTFGEIMAVFTRTKISLLVQQFSFRSPVSLQVWDNVVSDLPACLADALSTQYLFAA